MKRNYLNIITLFVIIIASNNIILAQVKAAESYIPEAVVDSKYGITMYEPLNMMLGNDSIRNDKNGYAANGFIEDYYTTGQLLHKGFYVDGQLKVYKNYYPNGNLERSFRMVDIKKSKMTLYYKDGTIKSDIIYDESEALKWQDFYPNGVLEYIEEYHKSFQYYLKKANYFEDGTPENVLVLTSKKKLIFSQKYYYKNGQVKEEGEIKYNKATFDYEKIGTWTFYDETGKPTKQQKYASGKLHSEKKL